MNFKKQRRSNFTDSELIALINGVAKRRDILFGKFDSTLTHAKKDLAWAAVAAEVNAVATCFRDTNELRRKFSDFKGLVKKKAATEKRYTGGTGELINTKY